MPMLVVFRIVFGIEVFIVGTSGALLLSVGTEGVELALDGRGVGKPEGVTDRLGMALLFGVVVGSCEGVELRRDSAPTSRLLSVDMRRVLAMGSAGSGPFGGGRGVRGMVDVEVMVEVIAPFSFSFRPRVVCADLCCSRPLANGYVQQETGFELRRGCCSWSWHHAIGLRLAAELAIGRMANSVILIPQRRAGRECRVSVIRSGCRGSRIAMLVAGEETWVIIVHRFCSCR